MTASRFRWLVESSRLYMPRVEQLASLDPLEGTVPDAQAAWWRDMIEIASPERATALEKSRDEIAKFVTYSRSSWCVSCWHMSQDENYAFWRIYSREQYACTDCGATLVGPPEGVAIVTNFAKLEAALPAYAEVGLVNYAGFDVGSGFNMFDYIMWKRPYYAYEAEVRAVVSSWFSPAPGPAEQHFNANIVNGSFAPKINLTDLITEVVVHPEGTETFLNEIVELCAQHGLPTPRVSGLR